MSSLNKAIIIGNLGRDPEVRYTNDGALIVSLAVATSETWKDKASGERKERTEWHNVVIFNENLGKIAEQYCKKGTKVYLEGQLQTREYTDRDGNQRRTTEVVLPRFRGELLLLSENPRNGKIGGGGGIGGINGGLGGSGRVVELAPSKPYHRAAKDIIDDDIPF